MKVLFAITLFLAGSLTGNGQQNDTTSTQGLATDLAKLVAINSTTPNIINLSGKEAVTINTNATAEQIIELTKPYLNSTVMNAKGVCMRLLSEAIFKKATSEKQKQQLVEVLCRNYLNTDYDIQVVDNILLQLSEKDFTPAAKKYVAALLYPTPKSSYDVCARLLAVAQIKESIPALWKIANKQIEGMTHSNVDVLASLARMGEREAGLLLCRHYHYEKDTTDYRYIFSSRNMVFSLDTAVLRCLVDDFKTIDLSKSIGDGHSSFYPARYLAEHITGMLSNYPYPKQYAVNARQLFAWLNGHVQLELEPK